LSISAGWQSGTIKCKWRISHDRNWKKRQKPERAQKETEA
jgi:hypothetical protein